MAQITVQLAQAKREFGRERYILTKINYTKQDAEQDEAYHKQHGRKTKVIEEDGFWLLYTKIGQ